MYKLFLSLRYLRKRLIAIFAVASVTLCVFMVLVVISVMGGFLEMVKERSRGLLSDIVIDNASLQGFPYYQELIDALYSEMPDTVIKATPVIYNYGVLRVKKTNYTKPVKVVGIQLEEYQQVNDFANSLYYDRYYPGTTSLGLQRQPLAGVDQRGNPRLPPEFEQAHQRWLDSNPDPDKVAEYNERPFSSGPGSRVFEQTFGPPSYVAGEEEELHGVIIGCDLINERTKTGNYDRYYPLGAEMLLTLLPITPKGTLSAEGAITRVLRYADDSRTGVFEIDSTSVYIDFDLMQRILRMDRQERVDGSFVPARASQVLVRLADGVDSRAARTRIEQFWKVDTLWRADLDGGGAERVFVPGLPDPDSVQPYGILGLKLHRAGEKLYWADQSGEALRANLDGSGVELVSAEDLPQFEEGDWNVAEEYTYRVNINGQIERLSVPGTDAQVLAATRRVPIGGFAVDGDAKKIYWIQRGFLHDLEIEPFSDEWMFLDKVTVETWQERQRPFINAVEKEKVLVVSLFCVVSVVAVVLIGCIFYMVVEKKTRDVGIIKSLGASSSGVATIFLMYGAAVGVVGSILGTIGGVIFVRYINEIQDALTKLNPNLQVWSPDVYTFDRIPNVVDSGEATIIVVVAIFASMLGALIPALLAARVWPVDALRYE